MSVKRAEQHSALNSTLLQRVSQGANKPPRHTHGKILVNPAAINRIENPDERGSNSMVDCKQIESPAKQRKKRLVQKDNDVPSIGLQKKDAIEEEKNPRVQSHGKNRS